VDLQAIVDAVRSHKHVAIVGTIAAILLSFLAFAKIEPSKFPPFERRDGPDYQSTVTLFVTQPGFPWGRSTLRYSSDPGGPPVAEGDPDRFATLAVLYANLANSGTILRKVHLGGKALIDIKDATVTADVPTSDSSSVLLPLIEISAIYKTKAGAEVLARQTTNSLVDFVSSGQRSSAIPEDDRVVLQMIDGPQDPLAVGSGSKTLPVLIFLTVMMLTSSTILVLRNLAADSEGVRRLGRSPSAAEPEHTPTRAVHVAQPLIAETSNGASADARPSTSSRRQRPPMADRLGQVGWREDRAAGKEG
jgi:hypothetical protein